MAYRQIISFLAIVLLYGISGVLAEDTIIFNFTNPPDLMRADGSAISEVVNFPKDVIAQITWETNLSNYTIVLTHPPVTLFEKHADQPEEGGFSWNISAIPNLFSSDTSSGDISGFQLFADPIGKTQVIKDKTFLPFSAQFTISDEQESPSSNTAQSTTQATSSPTNIPTKPSSLIPTTLETQTTSPTTSADPKPKSNSSSNKRDLYIGLFLGLVLLILIQAIILTRFRSRFKRYFKKARNSETEQGALQIPRKPSIVATDSNDSNDTLSISPAPSEHRASLITPETRITSASNNTFDISPIKSELPTPFNTRRSITTTFLAKFELPGKDNRDPNPTGSIELPTD